MDRSRPRIDIRTIMLVVGCVAASFATARSFNFALANGVLMVSLTGAIQLGAVCQCRAEGRRGADVYNARFRYLWLRLGLPTLWGCCALMLWLFPLSVPSK